MMFKPRKYCRISALKIPKEKILRGRFMLIKLTVKATGTGLPLFAGFEAENR